MTLSEFFAREHGAQSKLAKTMKIPAPMLSQWASGQRPIPIERCPAIELATDGAVRLWELRPDDWHRIWPMVIGTEGAPEVPHAEVAEPDTHHDGA